jgi:hypothetical protein
VWLGEAEEKAMPLVATVDYLERQLGHQEEREERLQAVADKYEKVLREIAYCRWPSLEKCSRLDYVRHMAREALEWRKRTGRAGIQNG